MWTVTWSFIKKYEVYLFHNYNIACLWWINIDFCNMHICCILALFQLWFASSTTAEVHSTLNRFEFFRPIILSGNILLYIVISYERADVVTRTQNRWFFLDWLTLSRVTEVFHLLIWLGKTDLLEIWWYCVNLRFCLGDGCHLFPGVGILIFKITMGIDREMNI